MEATASEIYCLLGSCAVCCYHKMPNVCLFHRASWPAACFAILQRPKLSMILLVRDGMWNCRTSMIYTTLTHQNQLEGNYFITLVYSSKVLYESPSAPLANLHVIRDPVVEFGAF